MVDRRKALRRFLDRVRGVPVEHDLRPYRELLGRIDSLEPELTVATEAELTTRAQNLKESAARAEDVDEGWVVQAFALAREAAKRAVGLRAFDVQVMAGLALWRGRLVEMQTGEGKTLAAVFPAFATALRRGGVHILTFNDYLARRDAEWMGPAYRLLGLSVSSIQAGMPAEERRRAYSANVTYATAKQVGFDFLRSAVALGSEERILGETVAAIVDEADALLVDEARVPMVIAGVAEAPPEDLQRLAGLVRDLRKTVDYEVHDEGRGVTLTGGGLERCEAWLGCTDLHAPEQLNLLTALNCALHAEALLQRDVDYIVRGGRIELVDEFTGRVIHDRQWPYGLQAALEAKEGLALNVEGEILGSITIHHFLKRYKWLCGMTATASAAAEEVRDTYELVTTIIPQNLPCVREDLPDEVFATRDAKDAALVAEIQREHGQGRPVLVGTRTVEESERLAGKLADAGIEAQVLNARNDEMEASIVTEAGDLGAVTVSTNLAGRGTDIRLGGADETNRQRVVELGGLYVIGTNRHESRRIDDQLRGRAGRQGDPGQSRFFVSLEDDLIERYRVATAIPAGVRRPGEAGRLANPVVARYIAHAQRVIEGQHHSMRRTLRSYTELLERQRAMVAAYREEVLLDGAPQDLLDRVAGGERTEGRLLADALSRLVALQLDREWREHLAGASAMRETMFMERLGGRDPLAVYHERLDAEFAGFFERVEEAALEELSSLLASDVGLDLDGDRLRGPASTWTYLIDDNPFKDKLGMGLSANIGFAAWVMLLAIPVLVVTWPVLLFWVAYKRVSQRRRVRAPEPGEAER